MNGVVVGLIGAGIATLGVVGGVQAYSAVSVDKDSVPRIVNGSTVTYADQ